MDDQTSSITVLRELTIQDCERIAEKNQKESPFLRLPPEIRNKICEFAFSSVVRVQPSDTWPGENDALPNALGLLSASRQIRHEALTLFYSFSTFRFQCYVDLTSFIVTIGPERASTITSIEFFVPMAYEIYYLPKGKQLLFARSLPKLERIYVKGQCYLRTLRRCVGQGPKIEFDVQPKW